MLLHIGLTKLQEPAPDEACHIPAYDSNDDHVHSRRSQGSREYVEYVRVKDYDELGFFKSRY